MIVDVEPLRLRLSALSATAVLVAGLGCTPEFAPAALIAGPRVIAVISEPPEATPGQEVTHTPIFVGVDGALLDEDVSASWWRCPDSDADGLGDFWECTVPAERKDLGVSRAYVDTVPADLFGTGTPVDPSTSPPERILGAVLGYWRVVGVTMTSADTRIDAFKRVPVFPPFPLAQLDERLAAIDVHVDADGVLAPNRNPVITTVTVQEGSTSGAAVAEIKAGQKYVLVPRIDTRLLEPYYALTVDLAGIDVDDAEALAAIEPEELLTRFTRHQRCEIPVFSWFANAGSYVLGTTVDERVGDTVYAEQGVVCPPIDGEQRTPEAIFTAPAGGDDDPLPADGVVHGWVVLRDGRGGTAVQAFDLPISQ